ncbi:3-phosphoshikimate 1-carboxyvinyltransferase [Feifania hominis]|uniref:3-phosphoshikimate 1-carboxyvinyltransferase n=1 Tax=Feifania hominis TaxID=2763660 RepID=A0A926HT23_9FIRM|nr:3-phosphoshikimate 1-carboxyvinyltransferase [Feifania hominis]MBC8535414.1 3-phosphoshikimate 1-carboxyvinyltransferase [Feifania hominis]
MLITPKRPLFGCVAVPGDKSISHRALLFSALAEGDSHIQNFLSTGDCLSTMACLRRLGIDIDHHGTEVTVHGRGLHGLKAPTALLDCGNSGTTTRLLAGILCGCEFESTLDGDASLRRRPMERIITPLSQMGATVSGMGGCCPLTVRGGNLRPIHYQSPVASAQLKSAVLLAGLFADGETSVTEPALSRNHTELMLREMGAEVRIDGCTAAVRGLPTLHACDITVPGDISSAAFLIVATLILAESEIVLTNVGVNETRTGLLDVLREMGADIEIFNRRGGCEPVADLLVRASTLHGVKVGGDIIPRMIDEIPILAVAALFASGTTVIRDAEELKVKETNRLSAIAEELKKCGAHIETTADGLVIEGGHPLHAAAFSSHGDHRMAMSEAVLALRLDEPSAIDDFACAEISYPDFLGTIARLTEESL